MSTSRLLQRIPAIIAGISTQAPGIRFPEQLQDADNVVFSLTDGARRRSGTQAWFAMGMGGVDYQYKMYRIERDDEEEYAIVYGRSCFQVVDLRNRVAAELEFGAGAQDYLTQGLPLASELKFVTIADTTIIANTKVNTGTLAGTDGAELDPAKMPIRMQRISVYPTLKFRLSRCEWKGRTFSTQVLVPSGVLPASGSIRISYKGADTFTANNSAPWNADIPMDAKASDPTARSSTYRGGIEQYLSGNGKSPADQNAGEEWKALTGLPSFPYGKVIVTGGPLSRGKRVTIRLSPDVNADELMSSGNNQVTVTRGDNAKNPPPTLVSRGLPITELGYHRNRLIIASDELIAMSQADDVFNFYAEDESNIVDSDPIDVELAANDVTVIQHILPYRSTFLVMTAAGQQFELAATDVLGPNSVVITPTTRYPAQSVRPIQQADRVYFAGSGDQNSIIYEYFYADTQASNVAANVTKHVETLIPSKVLTLTGAANSDSLYVLAVPNGPERVVMSATEQADGDWSEGTSWTIEEEPTPWDEIIIVQGDTVTNGLNEGGVAEDGGSTIPDVCIGLSCLPGNGGQGSGTPVIDDGEGGGEGGGGDGGGYSEEDGITADGTIYAYRQYTIGNERKQSAWSRWTFRSDEEEDRLMDAITVDDELFVLRRETRGTDNWLLIEKIDIADLVAPTPGFPWRVHLDKMVLNAVSSYSAAEDRTTWDIETGVPGYRIPDADSIVLLGEAGVVERRNALLVVDPTGRYVSTPGDWTGVPAAIGRSFRSSITLSPLYFRAEQPIDDGRTQIAKVIVGHSDTGSYRVAVSNRNGQPTRYTNYSSGSIDQTGIVQAWVMARNRDVTIRLESSDHRPCTWSSVEIHGLFGSHNAG